MLNSWQFDFSFSCNCLLLSITLSLRKGETKHVLEHSHSLRVQLLPHLNTQFANFDVSIEPVTLDNDKTKCKNKWITFILTMDFLRMESMLKWEPLLDIQKGESKLFSGEVTNSLSEGKDKVKMTEPAEAQLRFQSLFATIGNYFLTGNYLWVWNRHVWREVILLP